MLACCACNVDGSFLHAILLCNGYVRIFNKHAVFIPKYTYNTFSVFYHQITVMKIEWTAHNIDFKKYPHFFRKGQKY